MNTFILKSDNNYYEFDNYLKENDIKKIFVVALNDMDNLDIGKHLKEIIGIEIKIFKDFVPNPTYESVVDGVREFKEFDSKVIMAIGGGSAMDVAKCIKLFSNMDDSENYLTQPALDNDVKLMAVPTTAGTGSEATKFAVIYYQGEKQSITHDSIIPSVVLFDPKVLITLPLYQKKATMLDALSHALESYWSINSTEESMKYSKEAIKLIIDNYQDYLNNDIDAMDNMLRASNIAGKAINIARTTAGHAMCYKLTSLYKIPHGHAVGLVNSVLIPFMIDNIHLCIDERGEKHLLKVFDEMSLIIGSNIKFFLVHLLEELSLYDLDIASFDIELLSKSVNLTRLKNHPIKLDEDNIKLLYKQILDKIRKGNKHGS